VGTVTDGGIAADHRVQPDVALLVAPTHARAFNTVRPLLHPNACCRLDDLRFDFDSSFVLPTGAAEFALLAAKRAPEVGTGPATGLLLSVFGHADPTGEDDYNKTLAGRRASAVYAVLIRDADRWEKLYSNGFGGDVWSLRHVQLMLGAVGNDPGETDGQLGTRTQTALRDFQQSEGIPSSGAADKATRKALFLAYMDTLCRDASGQPFQYRKQDFLSRGTGADGKADLQGCGEFNPVLVFSEKLGKEFKKPERKADRDAANVTNRRVLIFMFDPKLEIDATKWPCPTVEEGAAGCRKKFWKDGDERRQPKGGQREFLKGGGTFACNFYERLAASSPCEGVRQALRIFLLDGEGKRLAGAPYRLTMGPQIREGISTEQGALIEQSLIIGASCTLEWGVPDPPSNPPAPADAAASSAPPAPRPFKFSREILLSTERESEGDTHLDRQLHNLGFTEDERKRNQAMFKFEYASEAVNSSTIDTAHRQGLEKQLV